MLFNSFKEAIFLKEDSSMENDLKFLKEIREKVNDKSKIDKDIKLLEYGLIGEKNILFELKNSNIGMYVLHDITIKYEDLTAQIDYVIITKGYTYLVECKNLYGNIYVDNTGQYKREYIINNKKIKEAIYSPYTQSVRHVNVLKKIWLSNHNKILTGLLDKEFDNKWYKPIVVLANPSSVLNVKYAPIEVKNRTIRADKLVDYIKNDLKKFNFEDLNTKKDMSLLANNFLKMNIDKESIIKEKYSKYISDNIGENVNLLENKLKEYRTNKSKKMNVPAYYIFNNEELNKLIDILPKNIDELKEKKILSDIKIKCHGKEIIDIINKN